MADINAQLRGELQSRIGNWRWRMNNLYTIIDVEGRQVTFRMNHEQEILFDWFWFRNLILKARQFGVTTFFSLFMLDRVLFRQDIECGLIAQNLIEASNIFRKKILYAYENLPQEIKDRRPLIKRDGGEIIVDHGGGHLSALRVATSMRSDTLHYLHVSEFGKICAKTPDKADEIISGSLNAGPKCVITIESTAEGRHGHFFEMCQDARHVALTRERMTRLDYRFFFFPWFQHRDYRIECAPDFRFSQEMDEYFTSLQDQTGVRITRDQRLWYVKKKKEQKDKMKQEFPSTPDEAFEQTLHGAYYTEQMNALYQQGRVCDVEFNPDFPVHTAWDIGHADSTAIWFYQRIGRQIHFIDYMARSGQGLAAYWRALKKKSEKLGYVYGRHTGPHDLAVVEWGSGKSRLEQALDMGLAFEMAPKVGVEDGIDAVREMFKYCVFDQTNCKDGLAALAAYRKEWDEKSGCWRDKPCHDWTSHGADSFRYAALSSVLADKERSEFSIVEMGAR